MNRLLGFCCEKLSVGFRSAKAAWIHRYFRGAKGDNFCGAKGDNPANLLCPQRKLLTAFAAFLVGQIALAGELEQIGSVKIKGDIAKGKDISALGIVGDYLVIGSDEIDRCQVLKSTEHGSTLLADSDIVLADAGREADIEGIACEGNRVYVIGSHARVRPNLAKEESYRKNQERIKDIRDYPSRDVLACFTLQEDGKASPIKKTSLRAAIEANPILHGFARIPADENGVNIEGLAVKEGRLYVGFRGPILRGNHVPILVCDFDHADSAKLLWVNLDGLGIRDMASTKDGFLILAGPMGDGPGSFKLFSWNGHDCLPGVDRPGKVGEIKELCRIPHEDHAKAEGMVITKESDSFYEFLIAYDGPRNGGIKRFRLSRP